PPMETHLLLRTRLAGGAAEGLERQAGKRRRGAGRFRASRRHERPRRARQMEGGPGKEGGVTLACVPATICRPARCLARAASRRDKKVRCLIHAGAAKE